jgi:hypothetical protein
MRVPRSRPTVLLCAAVLVAGRLGLPGAAWATSAINVDLHRGEPDPINAGAPSSAFAAASSQAGSWNGVTVLDLGPHPLLDTAGNSSGASLTLSLITGGRIADNPTTFGDDEALLDDGLNLPEGVGFLVALIVSGLAAGQYQVYTYAWDPNSPSYRSANVDVNGTGAVLVAPPDDVFDGYSISETHAVHSVMIGTGNDLVITITNADDIFDGTTVNGFQIVPGAPEPAEGITWGAIKKRYH